MSRDVSIITTHRQEPVNGKNLRISSKGTTDVTSCKAAIAFSEFVLLSLLPLILLPPYLSSVLARRYGSIIICLCFEATRRVLMCENM